MRRFYFHLIKGTERVPDEEGEFLRDEFEARQVAVRSARELLANAIRHGKNLVPKVFVITDEQGQTIDTVPVPQLPELFQEPVSGKA
jgi:hypothetical protein